MLTHLQIRDFAIIDLIDLEVRAGLTVLTGETGAGKSIVVDALALLAGGKGGAEVVRAGTERAELSATFDISDSPAALREMLAEQSVDAEDELTVRRVIASDGRSRGYLNGVSVPLQLLRDVGDAHRRYPRPTRIPVADALGSAQRELLDDFGNNLELADSVREAHKVWVALVNRTIELEGKARDRESKLELFRFQVSELKALDLKEGEVAQLTEERTRHSNRGRLAEAAQAAVGLLYDSDEGNAHATASRALAGIKTLSSVDQRLAKVIPMVDEATIQIREAARELSRYLETLDIDPARQEEVERRLAAVEELSRKHRVQASELAGRAAMLEKELAELESADNNLTALKKAQAEALEAYRKLATQLTAARQTSARALSKDITARMQTLGMAGGRFLIDVTQPTGDPTAHGFDAVEFRVTANPGPAAATARESGVRWRARAALAGRAGRLLRPGCALHGVRRSRFRRRWRGRRNRRPRAQGAGILRPGHLRDASAAGRQGRPSSSARLEAHRRQDHAHQHFRAHHGRARRRNRAHVRRHGNHQQGARACARDAADGGQPGSEGTRRKAQGLIRAAVAAGQLFFFWSPLYEGQPGLRQWPYKRHRVIAQLVPQALGDLFLTLFDGVIHELFDAAAVKTDDMIVMRSLVELEHGHAVFKMMARHQAGGLELREHAVHGREADVLVRLDQALVDALSRHMTSRAALENLENLEPRTRDFEAGLAQIFAFQTSGLQKSMRYDAPP